MDERLPSVLAEIRTLLDLPSGSAGRSRVAVEDTLTTGYAYVLELERARLRAERGLRDLLRADRPASRGEVVRARDELARAEREVAGARRLLSTVRAHVLQ